MRKKQTQGANQKSIKRSEGKQQNTETRTLNKIREEKIREETTQ